MDLPLNFTGEFRLKFDTNFKIPLKSEDQVQTNEDPVELDNSLLAINSAPPPSNEEPLIDFNNSPLAQLEETTIPKECFLNPELLQQNILPLFPLELQNPAQINLKRKASFLYTPPIDENFPDELKSLIQPFFCLLCNVKSNSWVSAKQHYDSKNHGKKVKIWLENYSQRTGEIIAIKKQKIHDTNVGENAYYCDVCDLKLTSIQHASQHFEGKKHQMVVYRHSQPSGSGYYNSEGKWTRTLTKGTDPNGRFGIGTAFLPVIVPEIKSPDTPDLKSKFCSVCSIYVSSESQLQTHFEGLKHAKKLKSLGAPPISQPQDTIYSSLDKTSIAINVERDISIYRTPSGNYYCSSCDLTIQTDVLFMQHLDCKKHVKTVKKD